MEMTLFYKVSYASKKAYVVHFEDRHGGFSTTVFRSLEKAIAWLAAYCRGQWKYLFGDWPLTMPDDDKELIETFFAAADLDHFIKECAVAF